MTRRNERTKGQEQRRTREQENTRTREQGDKIIRGQDNKRSKRTRENREHEDKSKGGQEDKEPKNKRSKEQDNKGTREQGDKRTTYCNKVKCPPLDVFFERTKGQEDRIIWRAKLHPKRAPCKGRVLMTRKHKDKKTILIKYKRTREQDNKRS